MAFFLRDEERSLEFRIGGYFVMIHAFIGGFCIGPYVAWIEIGILFYRACDFSLDNGFSGFQDTNSHDLFVLSFHFFSCINIV